MATSRPPGGGQSGTPTARIGFDYSMLRTGPQVAREIGRATAREIVESFKVVQGEQRAALEQARQAHTVLRAQQAQLTATVRAESAARTAASRAEAQAQQQTQRVAANAQIEAQRRATSAYNTGLRDQGRQTAAAARIAVVQAQQAATMTRNQQAQLTAAVRSSAQIQQQQARATAQVQITQANVAAQTQIAQARAVAQAQVQQARVAAHAQMQANRAAAQPAGGGGIGAIINTAGQIGIGLGVAEIGRSGIELTRQAAIADRTRSSYERLAKGVGVSAKSMLSDMRDASRGLISDANLVLNANRAMLLGVADSSEKMSQLLEVARVRGQAVGISTNEAFTRLAQGIGKREIEILDELGIVIKLIPVYQEYAESVGKTTNQLSEAEKTAAIFNKVIADSAQLVAAAANEGDNAADKFERATASIDNAKDSLGEFLIVAGAPEIMTGLAREVQGISERFQGLQRDINGAQKEYEKWQRAQGTQKSNETPWWKADPLGDWMRRQETGGSGTMKIQSDIAAAQMMRSGFSDGIQRAQADLQAGLITSQQAQATITDFQSRLSIVNRELETLQGRLAAASGNAPSLPGMGPQMRPPIAATASAEVGPRFTREETDVIVSRYRDMVAIQRQQNEQITAEARSYGQQRAQTIANFEKQISREAADFARQRANAERRLNLEILDIHRDSARQRVKWEADLERSIGQARADSAERVAEWEADRNEQLAKTRAESADRIVTQQREMDERIAAERIKSTERLIELERDANKERERADTQYRRAQLSAAARLDAYALYQEQQRYADEQQEREQANREALEQERTRLVDFVGEQEAAQRKAAEQERTNLQKRLDEDQKAHDKRLAQEARALEKSITQQQEAHQRRLEEQAENDRLRIEDMRRNFEDQKRQEDDERGIRLGRMREDHNDQLAAMATAHGERVKQINEQAETERELREEKFQAEMDALGVRSEAYADKVKKFEDAAITSFDKVYEHILEKFKKTLEESGEPPAGGMPKQAYANGGWVGRTGNALVHQGEFVLSRAMLANAAPIPPGVRGAVTNNSTTTSLGGVNITIVQQPGQSPQDMVGAIDNYIKGLGGPYRQ